MSTSTSVPAAYIVGSRNTKPRSSVNTVEIFSIHDDGMEGFGDMDTFTDSVVSGESHPEARRIQLASGYLTAVQSIDYRYLGGYCTRAKTGCTRCLKLWHCVYMLGRRRWKWSLGKQPLTAERHVATVWAWSADVHSSALWRLATLWWNQPSHRYCVPSLLVSLCAVYVL